MNSLVSADYGSGSDSNSDDENTIKSTIFQNNDLKNFLRSASDDDSNEDDNDSDCSSERSKLKYVSNYWFSLFLHFSHNSLSLIFYWLLFIYSEMKKTILPSASSILLNGNNTGQVFNNPYKKAEIDQIVLLEKHVKMV